MDYVKRLLLSGLLFFILLMVGLSRLDGKPGVFIPYVYRQESLVTLMVNGRTQEDKVVSTLNMRVKIKPKTEQGLLPLLLQVDRIQASATRHKTSATIDTVDLKKDKPLPMYHFTPLIALMKVPPELDFNAEGKLAQVRKADDFRAALEELLKKDFGGTEEFENVSGRFLDAATEPALLAKWKNVLRSEFPNDFQVGKEWRGAERIELTGTIPSESWMGLIHASLKSSSIAKQAADDALEIQTTWEVPTGDETTTKLGPNEFKYTIRSGSGSRTLRVEKEGWVRESDASLTVNLSGILSFNGKDIALDMTLKNLAHIERNAGKANK